MNVKELREALEGYDDDMPVRFASQPNWPFEYDIADVELVIDCDIDADVVANADDDEKNALQEMRDSAKR